MNAEEVLDGAPAPEGDDPVEQNSFLVGPEPLEPDDAVQQTGDRQATDDRESDADVFRPLVALVRQVLEEVGSAHCELTSISMLFKRI